MRHVLWVVLMLAPYAGRSQNGNFSFSGRVVDGLTGTPVAGAVVTTFGWGEATYDPVTTGADGRFSFHGLAADCYGLSMAEWGERFDFRPLWNYSSIDPSQLLINDCTRRIWVGPDHEPYNLVFEVRHHPSISGTVRDEFGDPVAGAQVRLISGAWRDGHVVLNGLPRYFAVEPTATTADDGRYRFIDILPGEYLVCASVADLANGPVVGRIAPQPLAGDFQLRGSQRFYKRSCFPSDPAEMIPIRWAEQRQIDLTLNSAAAIPLRGRVTNSPDMLELVREDGTSFQLEPGFKPLFLDKEGNFEFEILEPGRYRLVAREGRLSQPFIDRATLMAEQAVTIEGTEGKHVDLTMVPTADIDMFFEPLVADGMRQNADSVEIGLRPFGMRTEETIWRDHGIQNARRLSMIPPGNYWLITRTFGKYCVNSAKLDGQEVLHGIATVRAGMMGRLDVTLTTQCSSIDGRVVAKDKPLPYARLAVLLSGTPQSPGDVWSGEAGEDGKFSLDGLSAGRYLVWAWDAGDPTYLGPATLGDVAARAAVVAVGVGQQEHVGAIHVLQDGGMR